MQNTKKLLINCDMGEWDAPHLRPMDEAIMPYIDMCNIACGGHAGSDLIMTSTINLATQHSVKIGAHPGYDDREHFGRKYIPLTPDKLNRLVTGQLNDFFSVCKKQKVNPHHIKAHGALYHACNHNEQEANILINIIKTLCPSLTLLVAPGSILEAKARDKGLTTMAESFIDRRYNDDLTLVSRSESDAVITDEEMASDQFDALSQGTIETRSGMTQSLISDTACIHGDNPNCLKILKALHDV